MIRRIINVALIVGFAVLWGSLVAHSAPPETLTGKVVSIADGDTITLLVGKTQHKIRVSDIDCPERKQPFGTKAKQFAGKMAFGNVVTVRVVTTDRYGRLVARVILPDGKDLSTELVKAGLAWHYKKYSQGQATCRARSGSQESPRRPLGGCQADTALGVATGEGGQGQGRQAAWRRFRRALVDQLVRRPAQLDLPLVSQEQGPAVWTG